jgi:ribosome-associated protein
MKVFPYEGEYITLQQVLKVLGVIGAGGDAKGFLSEVEVTVNGEREKRRGRKLRDGDRLLIPDYGETILKAKGSESL